MTAEFQWLSESVELPKLNYPAVQQWIEQVAANHDRMVGALSYIFCSDDVILRVNRQFLNHDYFTDIITFDDTRGRLLRGDMYISLDTVATNAELVDASYDQELLRVIIHGVLHLCGINDKGPGEREIMEMHENQALELINTKHLELFSK